MVDAILAKDETAVLTALASNPTAQISPDGLRRLIDKARDVVALRSPLARHPNLSNDLAEQLYLWVGRALRDALTARFQLDPEKMAAAVEAALRGAHAGASAVVDARGSPFAISAMVTRPTIQPSASRRSCSDS